MSEPFSSFAGVRRVLDRLSRRLTTLESRPGGGGGATPQDYNNVLNALRRVPSEMPGLVGMVPTSRCTARLVVGSVIDENPGDGPLSMWSRFVVPASLATNAGICGLGPNEAAIFGLVTTNSIALGVLSGDVNLFVGNSSAYTRYELGMANLAGQVADVVVVRNGANLAAYVNGTAVTLTAINVNGGVSPGDAIVANWAHALAPLSNTPISGFASPIETSIAGPIHRFVCFNRALNATEAASLITVGVSSADQWGSKVSILANRNGGFETAGGGGADAFANWVENTGTSSGTITRDTAVFSTGLASCRFSIDSSGGFMQISQNPVLVVGKRYRVTTVFRHDRAGTAYPYISGLTAAYIPQADWTPTSVAANTWQEFTAEFIATTTQLTVARSPGPLVAHNQWYDNIRVQPLGAFLDLQFFGTCGNQAPDAANQRDAVLFNNAAFTLPDAFRGFARWVATAPGGERIGGNTTVRTIPLDASISRIMVRNISVGSGQTVSIGISSGSLTTILNAAPLGGNDTISVFDPIVSNSTTGELWISYSGTGSIEVTTPFERS